MEKRCLTKKDCEHLLYKLPQFKYFFQISLPATLSNGTLGHFLLVCPDQDVSQLFIEVLTQKAATSFRTPEFCFENLPGDIASVLTSLQENSSLVSQCKYLNLSDNAAETLAQAMSQYAINVTVGKGSAANSIHLNLPKFSVFLCVEKESPALFSLLPHFDYVIKIERNALAPIYEEIITDLSLDAGYNIDKDASKLIVRTAQYNIKTAERYLNRIFEYIRWKQLTPPYITHTLVQTVFETAGIDAESEIFSERNATEALLQEIRNSLKSIQADIATIQADLKTLTEERSAQ